MKILIQAHQLPNYSEIYSAVVSVAGEGELISPESVGKRQNDFTFEKIFLLTLKNTEVLYSMSDDGQVDVDFLGKYKKHFVE